ncbi:hypothetical protein ARMGADRAFT_441858 [Armillaria gallica]|uniref:Heterokaryon incompatibility domain-containing protein n=1 Tax=Armillaria gallica TaxID=47427 RepID=A0A2H3DG74_ARMGA|nr:hypothetical protein ARMGADRAFT_441858 [Armillaria gallica]
MKAPRHDVTSGSDQNTNIPPPSESQEAILRQNSTAEDGGPISEALPGSLSDLRRESSSKSSISSSPAGPVDEQSSGDPSDDSDTSSESEYKPDIALPEVTISACTETGQAELSIIVPFQRSYTGRKPIISSSLANTPCATLGIEGILDQLNVTLGTSHTLDTPSLLSLLNKCIEKNNDFGTAYGRLRQVWNTDDPGTIQDKLRRRQEEDRESRRKALIGNRIVNPSLPPRRVWDLYSNRVVPWWAARKWPRPISHTWVDEKDRIDVWTPTNGYEWPVPIPKDASLDLIRIEMLNLGAEYVWLDVLCLRQKDGPGEDMRVEEWKLDVPTVGCVFAGFGWVVIYLSGLGRPLTLNADDLDSNRSWFRRAWTLQELGHEWVIAGDTPDGPVHAQQIDEDGDYVTELLTRFHQQLKSLRDRRPGTVDHARVQRLENREVTIRASVETSIPASSIKIPLQRDYRGTKPVIESSLANTSYNSVDEVLRQLNATLETSYEMTSSLSRLLQSWIDEGYDFGTAYGRIRPRWNATTLWSINENLRILEKEDQKMRKDAVIDGRTVKAQTPPRRVWDLYSNRVVPQWAILDNTVLWAISHAWVERPEDVETRINGREWPVPIPKGACLDRIRIELLNLGAEYVWVDVLCLRQKDEKGEAQRQMEWLLDVPTIGYVYRRATTVVYYFSGLGMALSNTAGDVGNKRCWFRRAWTLQEINRHRIYAGATDDYLIYDQAAGGKDGDSFRNELLSLGKLTLEDNNFFKWCRHMQNRNAVHPRDKYESV